MTRDGPRPRYWDDASGWKTKNIENDINQALATIEAAIAIGNHGSAPRSADSLGPAAEIYTGRDPGVYTAADLEYLSVLNHLLISGLNTVPQEVLQRILREREEAKQKLPPLPFRLPGGPPETLIKVQPLPDQFGRSFLSKPPGGGPSRGAPIPIVPLNADSSIVPSVDPRWLGPASDYEWVGEGEGSSFLVGPIGGRGIHPGNREAMTGPSPLGGGPQDSSPGRPGQRPVLATPGGGGQLGGGPGPGPGQGGTLISPGQSGGPPGQGGGPPYVSGGASQKGGPVSTGDGGGGADLAGRGGNGGGGGGSPQPRGKADGGIKEPASGSDQGGTSSGGAGGGSAGSGSVPDNPYASVPDNPYESSDGEGSSADSGGGSSERTTSGRGGRRARADDPHEHQPSIDITLDDPLPPELDPHGGGGGGSDLPGQIRQARPRGVTQQDVDLVGPAFRKVTGPDDKERPATGGTTGTASTDQIESRADDVAGLHRPRGGGGGDAGSAFEILLKQLGLWEKWQAGGPDPTN